MRHIIKDVVEMAYMDNGGTIDIEYSASYISDDLKEAVLEIIDGFDHSIITDKREVAKFSHRFFLLEKRSNSLFSDVAICFMGVLEKMGYTINDIPKEATLLVKFDGIKEEMEFDYLDLAVFAKDNTLVDFNIKD